MLHTITFAALALLTQAAGPAETKPAESKSWDAAQRLLQNGRYAEAEEAFLAAASEAKKQKDGLTPQLEAALTMGRADCQTSHGETAKAIEALKSLAGRQPRNADVTARLAELHFQRGEWELADAAVKQTLDVNTDHLLGRWVAVRLLESRGKLEDAVKGCKWFVDHYNTRPPDLARNARNLLLVGQAAERYYRATARGEELSDALNDVINEIYEAALRADPELLAGAVARGQAVPVGLQRAVRGQGAGPGPADQSAGSRDSGDAGPGRLAGLPLAAGRSKAERALEDQSPLRAGSGLAVRPEHLRRAVHGRQEGRRESRGRESARRGCPGPRWPPRVGSWSIRSGAAAAELEALSHNPRPATFYAALGERLADRRKYLAAERAFLQSAQADPSRADAPIGLGMLYMQIGRETEARSLFDDAFAADPFNVRADNMMKVLRHMASYTPVESDHYSVLFDPTQDTLLAKYMDRYPRIGLRRADRPVRLRAAGQDADRDHEEPPVVQRPYDRPALHSRPSAPAPARSSLWPARAPPASC